MLRSKFIQPLIALSLLMSMMAGSSPAVCGDAALPARPAGIDRFAGSYTLIKDQSEDPRQAIDRATGGMGLFARPIARRQLSQKAIMYPSFAMQRSGEFLNTSLPTKSVLSLPLSGSPVLWKAPDGEMVRAYLQIGPGLIQIFETKQGRRENHFTLSSDRCLLTVVVKFTSRQLPEAVEYRVVYRRS